MFPCRTIRCKNTRESTQYGAAPADKWLQVGLTSWGRGCADGYNVYPDVAAFESFITDVISGAIAATPAPTRMSEDPIVEKHRPVRFPYTLAPKLICFAFSGLKKPRGMFQEQLR